MKNLILVLARVTFAMEILRYYLLKVMLQSRIKDVIGSVAPSSFGVSTVWNVSQFFILQISETICSLGDSYNLCINHQ